MLFLKKYNTTPDQIMEWNRLKEPALSVDQMIIVGMASPKMPVDVSQYKTHTVAKGETMYGISKKYNVKVDDILKWNNKKDNSLSLGEKLKIKE